MMNTTKLINSTENCRSMMLYDHDACSINPKKKEVSSPNYRSMAYDASINSLKNHKSRNVSFFVENQKQQDATTANFIVRREHQNWIIFPWQVKSIPKNYPLELSHRMIHNVELKDIIQNLVRCFRKLNLRATYKNDKRPTARAILKLKSQTTNNENSGTTIEMNLYLWKIENNSICIELQRRATSDDRMIFHRYAKIILKEAATATSCNSESDPQVPSDMERKPFGATTMKSFLHNESYYATNQNTNQRNHHQHERQQQEQQEVASSISLVKSLLLQESNSIDAQLLGLKSLCILTDVKKTSCAISYFLSYSIVFGSNIIVDNLNHNATAASLHGVIMKMIGDNNVENDDIIIDEMEYYDSDDDEYYDSDDDDDDDDDDDKYNSLFAASKRKQNSSGVKQTLKRLGLTVLSNALETLFNLVSTSNDSDDEVNAHHNLLKRNSTNHNKNDTQFRIITELIINNLLKELAAPLENNLALKCIRLFCQLSFFFEKEQQRLFVGNYLKQKSGILLKLVSGNSPATVSVIKERECGSYTTKLEQEECKKLAEVLEVLLDNDDNEQ